MKKIDASKLHAALTAAIVALIFVAAPSISLAQDSTTNTNDYLDNPYFAPSLFGGSIVDDGSSTSSGTISIGQITGLPLDSSGTSGTLSLGDGLLLDGGGTFTSQATQTVTYTQQAAYLAATYQDGGGIFDQGTTQLGMWAHQNSKNVAAWRNFNTSGTATSQNKTVQVGDVFTIGLSATAAYGHIGFSLNTGSTPSATYANRTNGSRLFVQEDGTGGSWYVGNGSGTNTTLNYNVGTSFVNYTFKVYITSQTTADVELIVGTTTNRVYNYTLGGSAGANITQWSMYISDDWNGSKNENIYWQQTTSLVNNGYVNLGYYLTSGTYTPGIIQNGQEANSTTVSTNSVNIGGDSGTAVILNQANTYGGNTTVNAAATALAANNSAFGTNGTVSVTAGGRVQLSNNITVSRNLVLNGDGISTSGALQNVNGNNTWSGSISNNSGSRINSDSGTLTISGNITNAADQTLYVGGASNTKIDGTLTGTLATGNGALFKNDGGTLTLSGNNSGLTGLIRLQGGTISITNANSLGSGALELGAGATTATLLVNSNTTRTSVLAIADSSSAGVVEVASGQTFTQSGNLIQTNGSANTTKIGKAGAGTLVLSGTASTYGGQIQIGNGAVIIANNNSLSTNTTTTARGVDLGLNVGDVSQGNDVALLGRNGVTISNSIYVAPNTSSKLRTIGLDGTGTTTFNNEIFLDGTLNVSAGASGKAVISGALVKPGSATGGGLTKVGAGTVTLSGTSVNTFVGTTTVSAGVLELNKSGANAINGDLVVGSGTTDSSVKLLLSGSNQVGSSGGQKVTLSGGTIQRGSGVSEVFGNLNLTTASFLDFGTGTAGNLSFGSYTPSSLLTVQNFVPGDTLVFKSNLTSTVNNTSYFQFSGGFTSNWDSGTSTFTITAIPETSTVVAALGLAGMMLWPARRRLIRDAKSILGIRRPAHERMQDYHRA